MSEDLISRLEGENYVDAVDDAIDEIIRLRDEKEKLKKQLAVAVDALEKFRTDFLCMKMQQERKLVKGQTLETASKNWEAFPEMLSLDLEPLFEALATIKAMQAGGEKE